MKATTTRAIRSLTGRPGRIGKTVLYATTGSLVAVLFLQGTNLLYGNIFPVLAHRSPAVFLAGSFAAVTISSLLVGLLLGRFMPSAAGSGIPQLKAAYRQDAGRLPWRAAWVKLLGGIISLGGGASLGREGPTVYASGAAASALAGRLGATPRERMAATATGAAAGLSAAFNTPLAAITFVLEELADDLNSRHLGGAILAAVTGAFCTWALVGRHPAFAVPPVTAVTWRSYLLAPLAAGLAAAAGIYFQRRTLFLRQRIRDTSRLPLWLRPLIGGWWVWILGASVFLATGHLGVFSLGYDDLALSLGGSLPWMIGLLLLATKLTATTLIYGWGGCGGIFAPTLFFGAMAGLVVAGGARQLGFMLGSDAELLLSLVGMSACFGAVVRAPLTALLIVFEMTHRYEIVPALMIGTVTSQAIARLFGGNRNFYDAILDQDGVSLH